MAGDESDKAVSCSPFVQHDVTQSHSQELQEVYVAPVYALSSFNRLLKGKESRCTGCGQCQV